MSKKIILIFLILVISLVLVNGCRKIIKTGWYPHMWNFKIEGIEVEHLPFSNKIFGFYIHDYSIPDSKDTANIHRPLLGSTSSFEASQYFDRGETYEIELIIRNENVEGGRYELVDAEEKVKEIEQKYYTSVDPNKYSKYEYKTVIWEVKFIPSDFENLSENKPAIQKIALSPLCFKKGGAHYE